MINVITPLLSLLILCFAITTSKAQIDSTCTCSLFSYAPVVGADDNNYLNECWANCANTTIVKDSDPKAHYTEQDPMTWPIVDICEPLARHDFYIIRNLNDGTFIYHYYGDTIRGDMNTCKCLPGETMIATPNGEIPVVDLQIGDTIWTIGLYGEKIAAPILKKNSVAVINHFVTHLELKDGRMLEASPLHPLPNLTALTWLKVGDIVDGSKVTAAKLIPFNGSTTYDILPAGETGFYYANGIPLWSTLRPYTQTESSASE
jgi:hypothetical protein